MVGCKNIMDRGRNDIIFPIISRLLRRTSSGDDAGNFGQEIQDLKKNKVEEEYKDVGNFIHPFDRRR